MSETTTSAMPERLWVQRLSTDENEMSWYEGWETKDEEPMFPETEYVRADVAAAQLAFMREDRNLYYGIAQQQTEAIEQLGARITERDAEIETLRKAYLDVVMNAARHDTKLKAIETVIHRWIDSRGNGDLNNGGGMLEILNILYPSPAPTGDKKGTQP